MWRNRDRHVVPDVSGWRIKWAAHTKHRVQSGAAVLAMRLARYFGVELITGEPDVNVRPADASGRDGSAPHHDY